MRVISVGANILIPWGNVPPDSEIWPNLPSKLHTGGDKYQIDYWQPHPWIIIHNCCKPEGPLTTRSKIEGHFGRKYYPKSMFYPHFLAPMSCTAFTYKITALQQKSPKSQLKRTIWLKLKFGYPHFFAPNPQNIFAPNPQNIFASQI